MYYIAIGFGGNKTLKQYSIIPASIYNIIMRGRCTQFNNILLLPTIFYRNYVTL